MVGELLCPDCGGVVGATETTDAGPPCKCFVPETSGKYDQSDPDNDTKVLVDASPTKVCRICGADVSGKKRAKDHLGYYCYECAKEDEKKQRGGRVRCGQCGHLTKEQALIDYEGTRMCPRCNQERLDLKKQQIKKIGFRSARTREELANIYKLLYALGALILIIIISAIYVSHRHH